MWILVESGGQYSDRWENYVAVSKSFDTLSDMKDRMEKDQVEFNDNILILNEFLKTWHTENPPPIVVRHKRMIWNHNPSLSKEDNKKNRKEIEQHNDKLLLQWSAEYTNLHDEHNSKLSDAKKSFIKDMNVSKEMSDMLMIKSWCELSSFDISEINEV